MQVDMNLEAALTLQAPLFNSYTFIMTSDSYLTVTAPHVFSETTQYAHIDPFLLVMCFNNGKRSLIDETTCGIENKEMLVVGFKHKIIINKLYHKTGLL